MNILQKSFKRKNEAIWNLLHKGQLSTLWCWSFPHKNFNAQPRRGFKRPCVPSVSERVLKKLNFSHLGDPRAASVGSKHLDQTDSQEGEGQSPVDVHEVVHDVWAGTLQRDEDVKVSPPLNLLVLLCSGEEKNNWKVTITHLNLEHPSLSLVSGHYSPFNTVTSTEILFGHIILYCYEWLCQSQKKKYLNNGQHRQIKADNNRDY